MGVIVAAVASGLLRRVVVEGDSMRPTLLPGDRLLTVPHPRVRAGDLVVVADPRERRRLLVKRVATVSGRWLTVAGDNPVVSTDSRVFGPLHGVAGRPVYRYHPSHRAGWLPRRPGHAAGDHDA